jgi:hypothetical protein
MTAADEHPPTPAQLARLTDAELERTAHLALMRQQSFWLDRWPELTNVGRRMSIMQTVAGAMVGACVASWFGFEWVVIAGLVAAVPLVVWVERGFRTIRLGQRQGKHEAALVEPIMREIFRRSRDDEQVH